MRKLTTGELATKYVSFEEAKAAYKNGKEIHLLNDVGEEIDRFNPNHVLCFEELTFDDIAFGKWKIGEWANAK